MGYMYARSPVALALMVIGGLCLRYHRTEALGYGLCVVGFFYAFIRLALDSSAPLGDRTPAPLTPLRRVWRAFCWVLAALMVVWAGAMIVLAVWVLFGPEPWTAVGFALVAGLMLALAWYLVRMGREQFVSRSD